MQDPTNSQMKVYTNYYIHRSNFTNWHFVFAQLSYKLSVDEMQC